MFCGDCGSIDDTVDVTVSNLSDDGAEDHHFEICKSCLQGKGLWCIEHGQMSLYHIGGEDIGECLPVTHICMECTKREVLGMERALIAERATLLRLAVPEWIIESFLRFNYRLGTDDEDTKIVFGHMVVCAIYKRTFSQGLTDCVRREAGAMN